MSTASVSYIKASSATGWDDALRLGVERADETLVGLRGVAVDRLQAKVVDGRVAEWRVTFGLTFMLASELPLHE